MERGREPRISAQAMQHDDDDDDDDDDDIYESGYVSVIVCVFVNEYIQRK